MKVEDFLCFQFWPFLRDFWWIFYKILGIFAPKFFLGIKRFWKTTLRTTEIRWETLVSTLGLKILVLDLSIWTSTTKQSGEEKSNHQHLHHISGAEDCHRWSTDDVVSHVYKRYEWFKHQHTYTSYFPYSPVFTGMPLYTKPHIFKYGQEWFPIHTLSLYMV